MTAILFYLLAIGLIVTALVTIILKKSVTAAFSMVGVMFCLSGLYVLLNAHFMAALLIIVYAGAILVLVLFVIMLLNLSEKEGHRFYGQHSLVVQFLGIIIIGFIFIQVVMLLSPIPVVSVESDQFEFGSVESIGQILFTKYLLQFETASVLLLAAIVGAVVLALRENHK